MSRRSRNRRQAKRERSAQRENLYIANEVAARTIAKSVLAVEDRRSWSPYNDEPPKGKFKRSARLVVSPPKSKRMVDDVPAQVRFRVPREVAVCVRRKQRRSVLFAMQKTGKGARARKRRRTYFSDYRCA